MKHGYVLKSKDEMFGEITFGSFQTLREAKRKYEFVISSPNTDEYAKRHLQLVELVERVVDLNQETV